MGKVLTREGLWKDLQYAVQGTFVNYALDRCLDKPPMTILEVASGSGKLGINLALKGHNVWQVDIDPEAIRYSRRLVRSLEELFGDVRACVAFPKDFFNNDFLTNTFDLVFTEGYCHHFAGEQRQKAVSEMARVSRKWVCIIGSNGHCEQMRKIAEETNHVYKGMPPKQLPHTHDELKELMTTAGLKEIEVFPMSSDGDWEHTLLLAGIGKK